MVLLILTDQLKTVSERFYLFHSLYKLVFNYINLVSH